MNANSFHPDTGLVADLLGGALPRRAHVAATVLAAAGSPWGLRHLPTRELARLGVSRRERERLRAALALGSRAVVPPTQGDLIGGPDDAYVYLATFFADVARERFVVGLLDVKHRPLGGRVISEGSSDTCVVSPREVFRMALGERAAAIVVAHNHPSGDPTPSAEDVALTHSLQQAAGLVGVPLVDHLIVAEICEVPRPLSFYSFARDNPDFVAPRPRLGRPARRPA